MSSSHCARVSLSHSMRVCIYGTLLQLACKVMHIQFLALLHIMIGCVETTVPNTHRTALSIFLKKLECDCDEQIQQSR